mmetsp:Transcript_93486/g.261488  ORF Transcript_93486/g.261488 Transcript_93486/m.261488 type:complete len:262 (-) Transcript_93486:123-908(-)
MGQAIGGVIPGCCACTRCDIQPDELHVGVKRRLRVGAVLGDHAGCRDEVDSDGLHAFIEQLHSGAIDERGERRLPPPLEAAMHFDDGAGGKRPEDADVCEYSDEDSGTHPALHAFIKRMQAGVGLSLLMDGVGVLLIEARLLVGADPALVLCFNSVQRHVPLDAVEDVVVERAHSDSGAWLVRLVLDTAPVWTFLFDGTREGGQEAKYLGGCLRRLIEDVPRELLRASDDVLSFAPTVSLGCGGGTRQVALRSSRCSVSPI